MCLQTVDGRRCPPSPECCPRSTGNTVRLQTETLSAITGTRTHGAQLRESGIRERILISEGVTQFLGHETSYRWMPHDGFCRQAPIYIYGDKVAVHSGTLRRQTIIIDAKPLAQHLRALFGVLWSQSDTPWEKPAFAVRRVRETDAEPAVV